MIKIPEEYLHYIKINNKIYLDINDIILYFEKYKKHAIYAEDLFGAFCKMKIYAEEKEKDFEKKNNE